MAVADWLQCAAQVDSDKCWRNGLVVCTCDM